VFDNPVKQKLARGKAVWGAAAGVADELANQLTISTGVDFLWIDTEHSTFGLEDIRLLPVLARQRCCMPLIRVAGLSPNLIKKALDLGASGIMIPQVNNADEAALAVRASKYPPQGVRGVSPLWTFHMNVSWDDYLPHANQEICVVVQVESPEALDNVEAIAAVDGVDVVFAGPIDLSAALGVVGQVTHPLVQDFLAEFPARVRSAGKVAGISVDGADAALECYRQGYRFINIGSLLFAGIRGLTADLKRVQSVQA
jgi:4-hydroxy-2-oxoheptanedioate aldolase